MILFHVENMSSIRLSVVISGTNQNSKNINMEQVYINDESPNNLPKLSFLSSTENIVILKVGEDEHLLCRLEWRCNTCILLESTY
jgi:hypothetical protein